MADRAGRNQERERFADLRPAWHFTVTAILEEAWAGIALWTEEYNRDRPHRGVRNQAPRDARLAFAGVLQPKTLIV